MAGTQQRRAQEGEGASKNGSPKGRQFGAVFYITVAISTAFVLGGVFFTGPFAGALSSAVGFITDGFGWLLLLLTSFFLVFAIYLAFSRYGSIKLGKADDEPEFRIFPWFAMLFQAGMGVGLVFWGVSEPLAHYADTPFGLAGAGTPEAASLALQYVFFHWTLHPWAIYAVVGLAIAYFSFRKGEASLRISAALRPLLGDRVDGPVGMVVDVLAILATLFGVAVSLGLGTLQIDAGLSRAFGLPGGLGLQLGIIAATAVAYMLSASTPINRGVNFLSQTSIVLAVVLLGYFMVVGPTLLQLNAFTEEVGSYVFNLAPMSVRTSAFDPDPWIGEWTLFHWSTWIAWAPYVGAFIARISKGRTIRQFIVGVLLAPSVFSMLWFAVFGASAINLDESLGGALSQTALEDEALALFDFLAEFPFFTATAVLAIFLVWIFFIAGADAGTIVLGSMSSGVLDPRRSIKLIWGVIMAALAAILLAAGGLDALQNGSILAAGPFAVIMVGICWSLYRTIRRDYAEENHGTAPPRTSAPDRDEA